VNLIRCAPMRRSDFHFDLPAELIAQFPSERRSASRDTRVIPARLLGRKKGSGGRVEVLVERLLEGQRALVHLRASKSPPAGSRLLLEESVEAEVEGREGALFLLRFLDSREIPRPPQPLDRQRYQTVYARREGALDRMGVERLFVTLHVGAGTFQPVRVEDIGEHRMHAEYAELSPEVCERLRAAKEQGRRVIAVGTTTVRTLESAAMEGELRPFRGETDIFIRPGHRFRVVDALITNFHLPESTLLMLVSAFAGYEKVMAAYRHAVARRYRFFSYGDAMFLQR